jgi:hypothetical protein
MIDAELCSRIVVKSVKKEGRGPFTGNDKAE